MGEIYTCDKCGKIIKEEDKKMRFSIGGDELFDELEYSKTFYLCQQCSGPLVRYVKRFLKIKKNKEINK